MRHVGHEVGAHAISDLTHARVVDVAAVRARAGDDELGAEERRAALEGVVVDEAGRLVEAVGHGLEVDAGGADALLGRHEAVREVAAVRQVEAHDAVVRL